MCALCSECEVGKGEEEISAVISLLLSRITKRAAALTCQFDGRIVIIITYGFTTDEFRRDLGFNSHIFWKRN